MAMASGTNLDSSKDKKAFQAAVSRSVGVLVVLVVAVGGCAAGRSERVLKGGITKGPVLLRVYGDRAALMWETNVEGAGKVFYGREGKLEKSVVTEPDVVKYKENLGKKKAYIHKVWLENLEPGRAYSYRVEAPQSDVCEFRTVPEKADEVTFVVYGDSRTHPERHRRLVEVMMERDIDFVVHTGDLLTNGDKYEQWGPQFFEPIRGLAERVPFYITKGNHERDGGLFERLLIPDGETNDFGFDYGPIYYFCADNSSKDVKAGELLELIGDDTERSEAVWRFVSFHKPSLNFGGHWSAWGYPDALSRLSEAGVDFVLVGHSHQYERFRPIAPAKGSDGGYVTYITTGGGGAPPARIKAGVYHAGAEVVYHFCLFHIKGGKLTMEAIDIEGRTIDRFEITRTDGRMDSEYLENAVPLEQIQRYQKANLHREN